VASFVLDTHACVFALVTPEKLGRRARQVMQRAESGLDDVCIPAAAAAEIQLLRELGRTRVGLPEVRAAIDDVAGLRFLDLDLAQIDEFAALVSIRDPFDRLILGAARAARAKLVTRDRRLSEAGLVEVIWD
jgi:PIN domain nuclease of toxin-antitoxin system